MSLLDAAKAGRPFRHLREGLTLLAGSLASGGAARSTVAVWLSYAVSTAIALVLTPVVIRGVGPQAYGVWLLLAQVMGYGGLLDSAIQIALVRSIARMHALEGPTGARHVVASALVIEAALGMILLSLVAVLSLGLARWFNLGSVDPTQARHALLVMGLSTSVSFAASAASASLKGLQRFDLAAALAAGVNVVRAVGTYAAIATGAGVLGLAAAVLVSNSVGLIFGFLLLHRQLRGSGPRTIRPRAADVSELVSRGALSLAIGVGSTLAYSSDSIVIATLLTAADVAHFGLAASVVVVVGGFVGAFTGSLTPRTAIASARNDMASVRALYVFGCRVTLYVGLPILASLSLFGPELLSAWVGPEVGQPAGQLLRVLALAHLPVLANAAGVTVAVGLGIQRQMALLTLAEGTSNVLLSIVLARRLGVLGVAIGTLLPALLFQGVVWPAVLWRYLGVRAGPYFAETARPLARPSLAFGAAVASFSVLGVQGPARVLMVIAVAMAAFWITGILTGAIRPSAARGDLAGHAGAA